MLNNHVFSAADTSEDYGDYSWNLAMTVSETTTNYKMVEYFANLVKEKSNGSINIELYPGGQLANTTEQDEACVSGSIEMVTGMTADLTDFVWKWVLPQSWQTPLLQQPVMLR